ncbi:MAG: nitroreductase [Bacteroidota bacterium]
MTSLPTPDQVRQLLRERSSIYPPMYTDTPVDREIVEDLLQNATWAPNHRKTEPWRFKVFRGAARQQLADALTTAYRRKTDETTFSEKKFKKLATNPLKADTIIAICMQRDLEESLPEWEELAAVAMAVQNLWLSATAHGLGGYWSSPSLLINELDDFLALETGERCYGFFYLAHHQAPTLARERQALPTKVVWRE